MKVKHSAGAVVDVPEAKAAKLAATGSWTYVDKPPASKPVETVNEDPDEGENTPEHTEPVATIHEMRTWALKNRVEGVKEKGKLSRDAIEAYLKAHEEN